METERTLEELGTTLKFYDRPNRSQEHFQPDSRNDRQDFDADAFSRAKIEQQAANAQWLKWQTGLLSLRLGGGIPVTP